MKLIFCIVLLQWLFYWQEIGVSCEKSPFILSSAYTQELNKFKQKPASDLTLEKKLNSVVADGPSTSAENTNDISKELLDLPLEQQNLGKNLIDGEQVRFDPEDSYEELFKNNRPQIVKPSKLNKVMKRARLVKKFKPIIYDGYTLDINIDLFKSTRYCHYNEVCKNRYKSHFECVCPTNSLCVGQGSLFEGRCNTNLMPYVWIQSVDDTIKIKPKL